MSDDARTDQQISPVQDPHEEGPPPIGSSWKQLYAVVLAELVIIVALFYWFTKVFE